MHIATMLPPVWSIPPHTIQLKRSSHLTFIVAVSFVSGDWATLIDVYIHLPYQIAGLSNT